MWVFLVRLIRWLGIDLSPTINTFTPTNLSHALLNDVGGPNREDPDLERGIPAYSTSDDGMQTPPEDLVRVTILPEQTITTTTVHDNHSDTQESQSENENPLDQTIVGEDGEHTPIQQSLRIEMPVPLTPRNLALHESLEEKSAPLPVVEANITLGGDTDEVGSQLSAAQSGISVSRATLSIEQAQKFQLINNNGIVAISIISKDRMASKDWTAALAHAMRQDVREGKNVLGGLATDFASSKNNLLQTINTLGSSDVKVYAEWWLRATAQASYLGSKNSETYFPFHGAFDEGKIIASKTKTQFNAAKSAWERNYIAKVTVKSQLGLIAEGTDELVTPVKIGLPSQAEAIVVLKEKLTKEKESLNLRIASFAKPKNTLTTLWNSPFEALQAHLKTTVASLRLLETLEDYLLPNTDDKIKGFTYEDWLTLKGLSTHVKESEFFGSLEDSHVSALFQTLYGHWQNSAVTTIQVGLGLAAPASALATTKVGIKA